MAGEGQQVRPQVRHPKGEGSDGLRAIHQKQGPGLVRQAGHLGHGLDGAGHIGRVGEDL